MTKQTTKRVWQVARELNVSSKEIMKLSNKHHWFCNISDDEFKEVKNKLNKQGGKTMKNRREVKPEEMMAIFAKGGSFVLTLEGVERIGVKGNREYHLNGKNIISVCETDEECIEHFIDMVNDECYENWQVFEILESKSEEISYEKEYMHAAHILSIDDDAMWDRLSAYLFQDKNGFIYSKKTGKMLTYKELIISIEWVNKKALKKVQEVINEFEEEIKMFHKSNNF